MTVELVRAATSDGLKLDGALLTPATPASGLAVDVLLLLHGVGSNFYGSFLYGDVGTRLHQAGVTILSVNTRGRDLAFNAYTSEGVRRLGAAYEIVADCVRDVHAWTTFLRDRGFRRIGVLGHSLGAIKAVYAAGSSRQPGFERLIAVSPPRLASSLFVAAGKREKYEKPRDEAQRLVEAGRGNELMEITFPVPLLISAASFLDKYGPAEKYDILKFAGKLTMPSLFVYGGKELQSGGVAFEGLDSAIANLEVAEGAIQPQVASIPGADHVYTGCAEPLVQETLRWLRA